MTTLTARDRRLVAVMRQHGIKNPVTTLAVARKAGLPLAYACALLEKESGGGDNVWGHDKFPSGRYIYPARDGRYAVTETNYKLYKKRRGKTGENGMQGCGPCQLTWYSFQDRADALGGCSKPGPNMLVGFSLLRALIREYGLLAGATRYNGASVYGKDFIVKARRWQQRLA